MAKEKQARKRTWKRGPHKRTLRSRVWDRTGFQNKTLWDWLQLLSALAIPVVLAVAGFWFTAQQDQRQQQLENQRAKAERDLAEQRAQDEAVQAYLDETGTLLLEKNLRNSDEDSEARTLARARTLTVLGRLDASRKPQVLQFLAEADLVKSVDGRDPIISLADADLSGADLSTVDLPGANLSGANLQGSNLDAADLSDAQLEGANLSGAKLPVSRLGGANLSGADLQGANLHASDLRKAVLSDTDLQGANLSIALATSADLSGADLREANLDSTALYYADLSDTRLKGATMHDTHLQGSNLYGTEGLTEKQLDESDSLEAATMPNGKVNAGLHAAVAFEPTLSFDVNDGWRAPAPETDEELFLESSEGGQLIFTNPGYVYDLSEPSAVKTVPAPENSKEWASWFQRHPKLKTSEPVPANVGGASGMQIDVTATSALDNARVVCPGEQPCVVIDPDPCGQTPCVPLYVGPTVSIQGWKDRFVIVEVGNQTVLIDIAAPADKFDKFLPKAQSLLDTVKWEEP